MPTARARRKSPKVSKVPKVPKAKPQATEPNGVSFVHVGPFTPYSDMATITTTTGVYTDPFARDMRPVVIAIVSDIHAGSTTAICPPMVTLDDGGAYTASKAQQWLWQSWRDFWMKVERLVEKYGARLVIIWNGDMVDGNHHGTSQILSSNPNAQAAVVNAVMELPLSLKPEKIAFVRGTEAHVGQSACAEERIADGLRRDKRPIIVDADIGTSSHWHLRMDVQGVRFDFAHHGRVGTRPWTKPNATANLAAEIFYDYASTGEPHPHIAVRSHMHQFVDTHDQHPTRVIQTPAWQLATSYIHRIAPGKLADIGGIAVVVENGEPTVHKMLYHGARPSPVRL